MTVSNFRIENGLEMKAPNTDVGSRILFGSGAPGSVAQENDAEVGSTYQRTDGTGKHYRKILAGSGTNKWKQSADIDDITSLPFRSEVVRAATGHADPGATQDIGATPFVDDDAPLLTGADFAIGEYILYGVGGTPILKEITNLVGNVLTLAAAADPLADNDVLVARNYLPDGPDAQEKQAMLLYNGTDIIKLADFNWELATGIGLSAGFTPGNGTVSSSDTVESAIEKLTDNQADLTTLSGEAQGATDHGTFTGTIIADNRKTHEALQDLETAIEATASGELSQLTGVTAIQTLDEVLVDDVLAAEWELHAREDANPTRIRVKKLFASHDGTSTGDATNTDESNFAKLSIGPAFNAVTTIDLDGTGATQKMRLRVSSSTAGVTFTARRTDLKGP